MNDVEDGVEVQPFEENKVHLDQMKEQVNDKVEDLGNQKDKELEEILGCLEVFMSDAFMETESQGINSCPLATNTEFLHSMKCPKCQEVITEKSLSKQILFLKSENEVLSDELQRINKLMQAQSKLLKTARENISGDKWIIQEKDTELRIINKEKDNI